MANRIITSAMLADKEYLKHYGVLGMKWGVRRYQNPDGTLTQKGKNRYSTNSGTSSKERRSLLTKALTSSDSVKVMGLSPKHVQKKFNEAHEVLKDDIVKMSNAQYEVFLKHLDDDIYASSLAGEDRMDYKRVLERHNQIVEAHEKALSTLSKKEQALMRDYYVNEKYEDYKQHDPQMSNEKAKNAALQDVDDFYSRWYLPIAEQLPQAKDWAKGR